MQNDSLQAVVSNGQIDYDHSYQSTGQTPLSPLIIGSSGRQQQTQTSPGSVTVTATATQSLFDPYHSQRHSFSDCTTDSSSTCSRLSSESPRYTSESSTGTHESRFYGKLAPSSGSRYQRSSSPRSSQSSIKIARVVPLASGQRKRGRQSKDEQLASDNELPVSAFQISEMSLSELQQVLKNESLSEYQRQLIRKIRRRGKNKVAARTCRQRRTDRHDKMSHYI
ncbi:BZIP domain-containing protein [Caenorhabditis elegans]|nr:BZIP domain-containing protein [Caenorhabditis elegans]CDK13323.1 BZIP domain-containing protein [Caenorhabditis elegans]|eukprot:NP_001293683.1 Protein skinhead-1 [Caenorhabditis elegans]